jgi:hypothetical protein
MMQIVIRFLIGGAIVSTFAVLGDLFKPKSFGGLFGAAPSVALATLSLTVATDGARFAATESRSMMAGAVAFFCYSSCVSWVMMRYGLKALSITVCLIPLWLAISFVIWYVWLK